MHDNDNEPPEPAPGLTASDVGATAAALAAIRSGGIEGAVREAEAEAVALREEGGESTQSISVTDTPYLAKLARTNGAAARWAARWRPQFVANLRIHPFPSFAARACGVSGMTARQHRAMDPVFDEVCLEAEEDGRALVLASSYASAVDGNLEPVFHQGVCVGHVRKFSDRMRTLFIQGFFPQFRPASSVNVRTSGSTDAADTLDAAKAHEIVSKLSPLMTARHLAQIQGAAPQPLPGSSGGFVRLGDVGQQPPQGGEAH